MDRLNLRLLIVISVLLAAIAASAATDDYRVLGGVLLSLLGVGIVVAREGLADSWKQSMDGTWGSGAGDGLVPIGRILWTAFGCLVAMAGVYLAVVGLFGLH